MCSQVIAPLCVMRSSLDYAGFAQLCGRSPVMREIMRAHNRIIPRSLVLTHTHTHARTRARTHTHPLNGSLPGTTRVSRYDKGETNLDTTEATDSEWQWRQLGHTQVCTSLQTHNYASTPKLSFYRAILCICPSVCLSVCHKSVFY